MAEANVKLARPARMTHVAVRATDLDSSVAFYERYGFEAFEVLEGQVERRQLGLLPDNEQFDCQVGMAPDCDDLIDCTEDSCNEVDDECVSTPNDALCSNGEFCDGEETCSAVLDRQPGAPECGLTSRL